MSVRRRAGRVAEEVAEGIEPREGDYEAHGKPEGVKPDRQVTAAMDRHERAKRRHHAAPHTVSPQPLATEGQAVKLTGLPLWQPEAMPVPTDEAVQILSRDPQRESVAITNQSKAVTGTEAVIFIFRSQREAESFRQNRQRVIDGRQSFKGNVIPDGASRTCDHTEAVWAVAVSTGDDVGFIDLSPSRATDRRA